MSAGGKLGLAVFGCFLAFVFLALRSHPQAVTSAAITQPPIEKAAQPDPPAPQSQWLVSSDVNALTGERTITASVESGDDRLIIRQSGKKTDCFLKTGSFLETVENQYTSPVAYKFDEGKIVKQRWGLSTESVALFFQGDRADFLQKLRSAKRFVIQYEPADRTPKTVSFEISGFPGEIVIPASRPRKRIDEDTEESTEATK